eukprot:CAMPEP_0119484014 /NCGR_PEP_ID=MMETSP1344-20130328/11156_1 /TAXON_ID=236787 /ORGANISM="Florenciella parvula, Strain CCMP2471" /LENGTH=278 /DNA_ID=CAMNT_0007518547 /DNA_START=316 /DNA_END=1149 /DNA_ORIENTATION=+
MKMKVMVANETQGRVTSSARDTSCARGRGRGRGRAGEAMPRGSVHCTSPSGTSPHGLSVVVMVAVAVMVMVVVAPVVARRTTDGRQQQQQQQQQQHPHHDHHHTAPSADPVVGRGWWWQLMAPMALVVHVQGVMRTGGMRMARWLVMLAVATLIAPGDAVAPAALVRGVLPAIASVGRKHPCLFGCAVTTLKTASADIFTQKVIQKKPTVDLKRVGLFATFGLLYMGAFQYGLYNFAYTRMFPAAANFASYPLRQKLTDGRGAAAVCGKVAFDQLVHW